MILIRKLSTGIFVADGHAVWAIHAQQLYARHSVAEWAASQGDEWPTNPRWRRIGPAQSTTFTAGGIYLSLFYLHFRISAPDIIK